MAQETAPQEVLPEGQNVDKAVDDLRSVTGEQESEMGTGIKAGNILNEEARRARAAKLKEEQQLQMSYWGRHARSDEALAELIRNKPEDQQGLDILVAGLGRLEEVIEYVAAYKTAHNGSLEGLNLTCLDILDKESVLALMEQEGIFDLGDVNIANGFINAPRKPMQALQAGFDLLPDGKHYTAAADVREFVSASIERGIYLTSISEHEELAEAGVLNAGFDFVSANNIMQYIPAEKASATLNDLATTVKPEGLISIANDGGSHRGKVIEFQSGGKLQAVDQSDGRCPIFRVSQKDMV
jgi:hypothetical protein